MTISKLNVFRWVASIIVFAAGLFLYSLRAPVLPYAAREVAFKIEKGDGLSIISSHLKESGLIRSEFTFKIFATLKGYASVLKPGTYALSPKMSAPEILRNIREGNDKEVVVRIPDGASIFDVDEFLATAGVLPQGSLIAYASGVSAPIEGMLYPDTYRLFKNADVATVVEKLTARFHEKMDPILAESKDPARDLILASLLEKEVPEPEDRRIVAGILLKRVADKMPLQVDATICYAKDMEVKKNIPCYPLSSLDIKSSSPYNTYQHQGWPPGPIGSPGSSALRSALAPVKSAYWFYLSDPKTSRTIFSKTFDEHEQNRAQYLFKQ